MVLVVRQSCHNLNDDCLYVCDMRNNAIRKVTKQGGLVSTFAGKHGEVHAPCDIVFSVLHNCFYICSQVEHAIHKISLTGEVSLFVGHRFENGSADGAGAAASFYCPNGLAIDQKTGTLFVSDYFNNKIRKITPEGVVSTVAGTGKKGLVDGNANSAQFNGPSGICFNEKTNSLAITDHENNCVRIVDLSTDVVQTLCTVPSPAGILVTPTGSLMVVSQTSHQVMLINCEGGKYSVETIAGTGEAGYADFSALQSKFHNPVGVCLDTRTNIYYIADSTNNKIRMFHFAG